VYGRDHPARPDGDPADIGLPDTDQDDLIGIEKDPGPSSNLPAGERLVTRVQDDWGAPGSPRRSPTTIARRHRPVADVKRTCGGPLQQTRPVVGNRLSPTTGPCRFRGDANPTMAGYL
jgi:hypothetical protein